MNNFHFSKIIAGVGPTLAKETVLSKVINMVDVFRISLSGGFDDNNKKYIDTIYGVEWNAIAKRVSPEMLAKLKKSSCN